MTDRLGVRRRFGPEAPRERLPRALVRASGRHPWRVLGGWLLLCLVAVPGIARLSIETSTRSLFDRLDPAWSVYQRSLDLFGGDETVVVAIDAPEPFDPRALRAVVRLGERLERLPGVRRLDSIATQPVIHVDAEGTLHLEAAAADFGDEGARDAAAVAERARGDRLLRRNVVSDDGRTLAINLVLDRDVFPHYEEILEAAHGGIARLEPPLVGRVSGVPVFQWETTSHTQGELLAFGPAALGTIGVLLWIVFRSLRGTVFLLVVGVVSNWLTLAAIGAAGIPLSFTMVILPPILLALGAAYGMHLLTAAGSADPWERLEGVATPVALSGLTTAIGFVAMSVIDIDAVRYVGAFGALGVLGIVALTLTLLPACLRIWPLPALEPRGAAWLTGPVAERLVGQATRARGRTVLVWGALAVVALFGLVRVEVDTDGTRWFRHGTWIRDDYEQIRDRLSGISPMNVVVDVEDRADVPSSVVAPEVVSALAGLAGFLEARPEVGKVVSVADPLQQLHEGFTGEGEGLPGRRDLAEQYLLLLESVDAMRDLIATDRRSANVMLRVDDNGSSRLLGIAALAEQWWADNGPPGTSARTTGVMFEFGRAQDAIAWGQAMGLAIALGSIVALLLAVFRTPAAAGATMLPNAIPLVMIYGFMGFFRVPLDAGTVFVGTLALGIAVDDTVHLASAYYEAAESEAPAVALRRAFERVLPALTFTTFVVGAGFALLGLSDFAFIRNLGLLMAGVMSVCLLADVLLLPAVLLRGARPDPEA